MSVLIGLTARFKALLAERDGPYEIASARIGLRAARLSDYEEWARLRAASHGFLQPWEPRWPEDHLTRTAFRRRMLWMNEEAEAGRMRGWLIFLRDPYAAPLGSGPILAGGIVISSIRRGASQSGQLGYWMGAPYAGRGLMTEALGLVIGHAFGPMGLERLEAARLEGNGASGRLLDGFGFVCEGRARSYLEVNGRREDHLIFALLAEEWRLRR